MYMKKKLFKGIGTFIIIIITLILIKNNVKLTKAEPESIESKSQVTTLNNNSDLVKKLYDKLNMDLINNECTSCLTNESYNFMYYNFEGEEYSYSDDAKVYLTINYLYKNKLINNTTLEDKTNYLIEKKTMEDGIIKLFGNSKLDNFDYSFNPDGQCGITEYTYTKENIEINTNICNQSLSKAKSKEIKAFKDGNYVKMQINAFKYEINEENVIIKNFNDELITSISKEEFEASFDKYLDVTEVDNFEFIFKLLGDDYYLQKIIKNNV